MKGEVRLGRKRGGAAGKDMAYPTPATYTKGETGFGKARAR